MKIIEVCGIARSGKNTFCNIAEDILIHNHYRVKQYSFADQLRREVEPFLRDVCKVDVWTQDTELKKDIRDFLVWYGTTWWRKRDPKRWIRVVDIAIKADLRYFDIVLVPDGRYPNEIEWAHSCGGYVVHVTAYEKGSLNKTIRLYFTAPNEQEHFNDPIVKEQSDYKLEWEAKGLTLEQASKDPELKAEVLKALNSCDYFADSLSL